MQVSSLFIFCQVLCDIVHYVCCDANVVTEPDKEAYFVLTGHIVVSDIRIITLIGLEDTLEEKCFYIRFLNEKEVSHGSSKS